MSSRQRRDVLQLVKKYRKKYPDSERSLIRKLIRLENPELFGEGVPSRHSNFKVLDRHLKQSFEQASDYKPNTYALKRDKTSLEKKDDNKGLEHSRLLVLTSENARSEADLHLDEYSPVQIKELFFSKESVPSEDYYFLQHIETGYPEISELVTKHKELSNRLPKSRTEMRNIEDLLVDKIITIVDGVKFGKPLLGRCDCCP